MQKELSKQRWILNLIIGVETHHQDIIMDLNDERVRFLGPLHLPGSTATLPESGKVGRGAEQAGVDGARA